MADITIDEATWLNSATAEELVSNWKSMVKLLNIMSRFNMMNASGSAFRNHPRCFWKNGILIVDPHREPFDIFINIASVRNATIKAGCQNPCAHGDPYPSLSSGHFVTVWRSSGWVKRGPWEAAILTVLTELIETARRIFVRQEETERRIKLEREAKINEAEQALVAEWS